MFLYYQLNFSWTDTKNVFSFCLMWPGFASFIAVPKPEYTYVCFCFLLPKFSIVWQYEEIDCRVSLFCLYILAHLSCYFLMAYLFFPHKMTDKFALLINIS